MHCIDSRVTARPGAADARIRSRRVAARLAFAVGLGMLSACHTAPSSAAPANAAAAAAPSTRAATTMAEYRLQFARRLVAANPDITYTTPAPDPLLAIPVLEIEVNADGSVRHITVKRVPTQARDTVRIAIRAVERAAPFGDASRLPKPWKFVEVFLFDDDRHFKPRVLD